MPKEAHSTTSRLVTVRLDSTVRDRFDALAASSDRTLAQLVRYAVEAYLAAPAQDRSEIAEDATVTRHTSLRLPAALACAVDAYAARENLTPSDVLRRAMAAWLDTPAPALLGSPASPAVIR